MKKLQTAMLLVAAAAGLVGCRSASVAQQSSTKTAYLEIIVKCITKNDDDCPASDARVNGHAFFAPDPGRGPLTVEWRAFGDTGQMIERKKTLPMIRRVRYWNEEYIAKREKELGYQANDPAYRAWMKKRARAPNTILLFFLEGGDVAAEIADTSLPRCRTSKTEYCPDVGTEE